MEQGSSPSAASSPPAKFAVLPPLLFRATPARANKSPPTPTIRRGCDASATTSREKFSAKFVARVARSPSRKVDRQSLKDQVRSVNPSSRVQWREFAKLFQRLRSGIDPSTLGMTKGGHHLDGKRY